MVKDTIHTTEPDTAYLRGRQLLEKRKYAQALYVLHDYRDRNTAIALLSLGQDREALRILEALPATATSEYLRAIACSRLGRKAEGRRHFLEACRRDERMLLLLALCGLGACTFHEVEEIEVIRAPEGDGTIVVPDWDDTKR